MKYYNIEFTVNGKLNKFGYRVCADSIVSAFVIGENILHAILDGVATLEIISVSLDKWS